MKIVVRGPALTRTGYGEHCRFVLRALREIKEIDLFLVPVNWGESSWIWEENEEREWLDEIIKKTAIHMQEGGTYDASIQVTIPNEWSPLAPINIGVTAGIETDKVAPVWLEKANTMDRIVTISHHSKEVFLNSIYEVTYDSGQKAKLKCMKDISIVHYPVKHFDPVDLDLDLKSKFNFLTVSQWGPRKNLHATISWFVEEFFDNPDVGLIVKTFAKGGSIIDRHNATKQIKEFLSKYDNRKCKVYLLHGDMSEQEMHSLYTNEKIHCLVSLTHGEGFGLPLFEAAYSGMPVLATDWSGHLDFLYKPVKDKKGKEKLRPHFARVDCDINLVQKESVWDGVIQADANWAYAQQGSYKMKLREVYKDWGRWKSQAKKLQKWILNNFTQEQQFDKFKKALQLDQYFEINLDSDNIDEWLIELEDAAIEYE